MTNIFKYFGPLTAIEINLFLKYEIGINLFKILNRNSLLPSFRIKHAKLYLFSNIDI